MRLYIRRVIIDSAESECALDLISPETSNHRIPRLALRQSNAKPLTGCDCRMIYPADSGADEANCRCLSKSDQ